jgi:hypothetical protein
VGLEDAIAHTAGALRAGHATLDTARWRNPARARVLRGQGLLGGHGLSSAS